MTSLLINPKEMNYELAKKLNKAGFNKGNIAAEMMESEGETYYPTLQELIEACGENFESLHRGLTWFCNDTLLYEGSTPEEAVSSLWLSNGRVRPRVWRHGVDGESPEVGSGGP